MTEDELTRLVESLTKANEVATDKAIEKYVNGGIRALNQKMEDHNKVHEADMKEVRGHMSDVRPILEAYNGTKAVGNLIKWIGGIILTVAATWALIVKN